jgi:hypothetical protein
MNHKLLLEKYIAHVGREDGITFISRIQPEPDQRENQLAFKAGSISLTWS